MKKIIKQINIFSCQSQAAQETAGQDNGTCWIVYYAENDIHELCETGIYKRVYCKI